MDQCRKQIPVEKYSQKETWIATKENMVEGMEMCIENIVEKKFIKQQDARLFVSLDLSLAKTCFIMNEEHIISFKLVSQQINRFSLD